MANQPAVPPREYICHTKLSLYLSCFCPHTCVLCKPFRGDMETKKAFCINTLENCYAVKISFYHAETGFTGMYLSIVNFKYLLKGTLHVVLCIRLLFLYFRLQRCWNIEIVTGSYLGMSNIACATLLGSISVHQSKRN